MSISSTRSLLEKEAHSVWKYLMPPSGVVVVVLSPGSMMAGAEGCVVWGMGCRGAGVWCVWCVVWVVWCVVWDVG